MKYPKLVTAAILLITFAYIDNIQQEVFEKVTKLNPSQAFLISYAETSERKDAPVCPSLAARSKCSETSNEILIRKKVVNFFENVTHLNFTC